MKLVTNPEAPQGSDIKGRFGGIDVELLAGSSCDLSDPCAAELKERYPWLKLEGSSAAPEAPAEEAVEEEVTAPAEEEKPLDEKARKAALLDALKGLGVKADGRMSLTKLEELAAANGIA